MTLPRWDPHRVAPRTSAFFGTAIRKLPSLAYSPHLRLHASDPHEPPWIPGSGLPMRRRLYVGNLPRDVNEALLHLAFAQDGRAVKSVEIVVNQATGSRSGHAFLDMGSEEDLEAAIAAMDGSDLDGRALEVHAVESDGG